MIHPWLLGLGAALMSVPIIIHLLNKRKFKIVDWAAMEFLLDADRRNRRRIRLENLILLLLRCLAILLLGFLVARPFLSKSITGGFIDVPRYERIVMLDDSLSMEVRSGNQSAMEAAKNSANELVRSLIESGADETFTLFLMSDPAEPLVNAEPVNAESQGNIKAVIDEVVTTDKAVKLEDSLARLEKHVGSGTDTVNRVVYIFSDMRQRDWEGDGNLAPENTPDKVVQRMAKRSSGCYLVDVGGEGDSNLVVTSIRPEKRLVAGVVTRFEVKVANRGSKDVDGVRVRFFVGDSLSQDADVGKLAAGKETSVDFNFTFSQQDFETLLVDPEAGRHLSKSFRVRAEVSSATDPEADRLEADSTRFLAARVVRGVPVLIVDGDPSGFRRASESYYLKRALTPPGDILSGVTADVVVDTELTNLNLDKYQLIFLCNVFRLTDEQVAKLERFVASGNGLVLFPGDQTETASFNEGLFNEGKAQRFIEHFAGTDATSISKSVFMDASRFAALDRNGDAILKSDELEGWMTPFDADSNGVVSKEELTGTARFTELDTDADGAISTAEAKSWMIRNALSPIKLVDYGGGENDRIWARFRFDNPNHLVFDIFQGESAGFFSEVKVFRFWQAMVAPHLAKEAVTARFVLQPDQLPHDDVITDADFEIDAAGAPAIIEKRYGKGQVMALTIPADVEWTNFGNLPIEFVTFTQLLVDYMARNVSDTGELGVGSELVHRIDLVEHKPNGKLRLPGADSMDVQAVHLPEGKSEQDTLREFKFPDVDRRGFYELETQRKVGSESESVLFAANIDPAEGILRRANLSALEESLGESGVVLIAAEDVADQEVEGSKTEIWKLILILAAAVLCLEQLLGWLFGTRC